MRNFAIIFCTLLCLFTATAQDKVTEKQRLNELRLDVLDAIAFGSLDISYERIIQNDMGLGTSVFFNFSGNTNSENTLEDFSFTPFYRFYFFNSEEFGAKGFFVEAFCKVSHGNSETLITDNNNINDYRYEYKKFTDTALGVTIGKKWIHKKHFVFEINGGVGRFLGFSKHSPSFTARFGAAIGFRL